MGEFLCSGGLLLEMALAHVNRCLIEVLEGDYVLADAGYDLKTNSALPRLSMKNP